MTERKESVEYTLFGDLDGMTVADLRRLLDDYPDDARIDVVSEKVYGYGGWTANDREFFVFSWEEY
jgi:hypothetical protein